MLRYLRWDRLSHDEREQLVGRGLAAIFDPELRASIERLVDDVRAHGDEAVSRALAAWDGVTVGPGELRITAEEMASAAARLDPGLDAALDDAIDHVRRFNRQVLERLGDWQAELDPGLLVGEKVTPITSAGLFCPSGKASYPSVAYQLGVPAVEAGVPTIALVVPPRPSGRGEVDPAVLAVCHKLGIEWVFRVNGPAGVAALGFGTESIPRVRKVVGPGSPAVTCAQVEMQRHGVATMMVLGPTESLVLADETADPSLLAADLLIEAEHGVDSTVLLVTWDEALAAAVDTELEAQATHLPGARADAALAALGTNGGCLLVADLDEAVDFVDRFAPEHLQVAVDPGIAGTVVDRLQNAGEILIGQHTPFSAANFVIGCPASLPTSGFARASSGITVEAFLKRTAVAQADAAALRRMAPTILALADHEGFPAHGNAVRRRLDDGGGSGG